MVLLHSSCLTLFSPSLSAVREKEIRSSGRSRQPVAIKEFSPPPRHRPAAPQKGTILENSNHRPVSTSNGVHASSSRRPLKEFELPDFLSKKEMHQRRLKEEQGTANATRQLGDLNFNDTGDSSHRVMIPKEEHASQNFMRNKESSRSEQQHLQVANASRDKPRKGKSPKETSIQVEAQVNRNYEQMNGERSSHEQSAFEHGSEGLLMTREELSRLRRSGKSRTTAQNAFEGSQHSLQSATGPMTPRLKHDLAEKTSSKASSDTDSERRVHIARQVELEKVTEGGYVDYSLKRKYKKGPRENGQKHAQTLVNGKSSLRPAGRTPGEQQQQQHKQMNKHHPLSDSDSAQSASSHSFTDPLPSAYEKSKFSPSVRDHTQLIKDLNLGGRSPSRLYMNAYRDSLSGPEDIESPSQRHSDRDTSMGYVDSSFEDNRRVKRKDSLQAHLRTRIKRMEITNQDFERPRYDSDSTTVSDPSVFDDIPPFAVARKSATRVQSLNDLPDDILLRLFSFLPNMDLCRASGVCRKWQTLCWDPLLWENIEIVNYQDSDINKILRNLLSKLAISTEGRFSLTVHSVKLNGCELLADKGLGFIAKYCIDLEELHIANCCCLTSKGLQDVLQNCHNLQFLDASGISCINSICSPKANGFALGDYGSFLQLRHLDMSDCMAFDDLGLRLVGLSCGLLENLYLRRCGRISDIGVKHIASHCPHLRELSLSGCAKVRDYSLREIAKHAASLKYLSVAKCPVTDNGIKQIGKHCVRLKYLNMRGCEGVTDVGITHVAQNCLKLRSLDAGKCNMTDNGLHTIGIHCPQLRKLSIKGCDRVSDAGVQSIAAQCCSLQYLNVQECNLHYETFVFIREHCKNCIIEHTCPAFF